MPTTFGSLQHILPIISAILFCVIVFKIVKHKTDTIKNKVFRALGIFVSGVVLIFHLYKISLGNYNIQTDLPLYLCSFMALFIVVFTYYKKQYVFNVLVFWIIAGTSQAVITPDIPIGYPSFDFFRYWIAHLGLLVIIFYAIFVFKMKPKFKSVFTSFLVLQVYMVIIMIINYCLDANYSYLCNKPKSASVLDYLGDWPMYILIIEAIILPYFCIIYLCFHLLMKHKNYKK